MKFTCPAAAIRMRPGFARWILKRLKRWREDRVGGRLDHRTIIVTSAAQDLSSTVAMALAAEGAQVAVCGSSPPDATVAAIIGAGGEAIGRKADVADAASMARFVTATLDRFGRTDGLVNAALFASPQPKPFEEIELDKSDRAMQVNMRSVFECTKALLPTLGGGEAESHLCSPPEASS